MAIWKLIGEWVATAKRVLQHHGVPNAVGLVARRIGVISSIQDHTAKFSECTGAERFHGITSTVTIVAAAMDEKCIYYSNKMSLDVMAAL